MDTKDRITIAEIGEFGLIRRIHSLLESRGRAGGPPGSLRPVLSIGDDAAIIRPEPGWDWVLTCDVQVAGRHFREEWFEPRDLGRRAMTVNLSDVAAMGAEPSYALVSLGLPSDMAVVEVEEFYEGLVDALEETPALIIGGNLSGAGTEWFCDLTLVGQVRPGRALTRAGAQPGDRILVTGSPGRSAAGLALLGDLSPDLRRREPASPLPPESGRDQMAADRGAFFTRLEDFFKREPWARELIEAYRRPKARLSLARRLGGRLSTLVPTEGDPASNAPLVNSLIDLSDGLLGDLERICEQSGVRAEIELDRLPADSALAQAARHLRRSADHFRLQPSDDYELLFTASAGSVEDVIRELSICSPLPVTEIGRILPGETEKAREDDEPLVRVNGLSPGPLPPRGWDHF